MIQNRNRNRNFYKNAAFNYRSFATITLQTPDTLHMLVRWMGPLVSISVRLCVWALVVWVNDSVRVCEPPFIGVRSHACSWTSTSGILEYPHSHTHALTPIDWAVSTVERGTANADWMCSLLFTVFIVENTHCSAVCTSNKWIQCAAVRRPIQFWRRALGSVQHLLSYKPDARQLYWPRFLCSQSTLRSDNYCVFFSWFCAQMIIAVERSTERNINKRAFPRGDNTYRLSSAVIWCKRKAKWKVILELNWSGNCGAGCDLRREVN